MNKKSIIKYLSSILQKKRKIPIKFKKNLEKFNFIDSGFIDSLEIFFFIVQIEKKFKIKFSNKEINSKKFKIIPGITELIQKKLRR